MTVSRWALKGLDKNNTPRSVEETHHQRFDQACPSDKVALDLKGLDKNNTPRPGDETRTHHQRLDQACPGDNAKNNTPRPGDETRTLRGRFVNDSTRLAQVTMLRTTRLDLEMRRIINDLTRLAQVTIISRMIRLVHKTPTASSSKQSTVLNRRHSDESSRSRIAHQTPGITAQRSTLILLLRCWLRRFGMEFGKVIEPTQAGPQRLPERGFRLRHGYVPYATTATLADT